MTFISLKVRRSEVVCCSPSCSGVKVDEIRPWVEWVDEGSAPLLLHSSGSDDLPVCFCVTSCQVSEVTSCMMS